MWDYDKYKRCVLNTSEVLNDTIYEILYIGYEWRREWYGQEERRDQEKHGNSKILFIEQEWRKWSRYKIMYIKYK